MRATRAILSALLVAGLSGACGGDDGEGAEGASTAGGSGGGAGSGGASAGAAGKGAGGSSGKQAGGSGGASGQQAAGGSSGQQAAGGSSGQQAGGSAGQQGAGAAGAAGQPGGMPAACKASGSQGPVQAPVFVRNLKAGETGWFSSPAIVDLDKDGKREIVAPMYSTFVFDAQGNQLSKGKATHGRVYAPGVVADLDGDGITEVVVGGNEGSVAAYEFKAGKLEVKAGWPASTCSAGQCPEARGMAAADLDGDGSIEIAVTTTQTEKAGAQVFVFSANGSLYQPKGVSFAAWPRYNTQKGQGGDADFNGYGNHGYGCYGENVGIGNLDDDPELEIVVTYDNHQINVFNPDGSSVLASPWFTNPANDFLNQPMGWGQFIRWADPKVEEAHYHLHQGDWPDVNQTMWLQWTASPPNVVDLDGDGKNDVVGIPNAEMHEPYETQAFAFMALHGAQDGGKDAATRLSAFTQLPMTGKPWLRGSDDYYPPDGIPAPTTVDIVGDARPEIVAAINDGKVYALSADGQVLWAFDYAKGVEKTFASEVVVADLNRDGVPELVFGTYALAENAGRLVVLSRGGELLFDQTLPGQGMDGNGVGVPAAPTVGDVDGDGQLEIVVTTFDHGLDVFTVPGSGENCLLWPTGRGNLLRNGMGPQTK